MASSVAVDTCFIVPAASETLPPIPGPAFTIESEAKHRLQSVADWTDSEGSELAAA